MPPQLQAASADEQQLLSSSSYLIDRHRLSDIVLLPSHVAHEGAQSLPAILGQCRSRDDVTGRPLSNRLAAPRPLRNRTQMALETPSSSVLESPCHAERIPRTGSMTSMDASAHRYKCHCGCAVTMPNMIVMVGLPARGKTYMSNRLARYLNWVGIESRVFNLGAYRRKASVVRPQRHDFFRYDNPDGMRIRETYSDQALKDAVEFFKSRVSGRECVAIYDGTNTTRKRRQKIIDFATEHSVRVLFVESVCDDPTLVGKSLKDVKVDGPDYRDSGLSREEALTDFQARIRHYERAYEPMDEQFDDAKSYLRIYNAGVRYLVNRISGHIQTRVVYYLMNLRIFGQGEHIYLCRHGESEHNLRGLLGGNSDLSERGQQFALRLADYIGGEAKPNLHVWTSSLRRTKQTARWIRAPKEEWKCLDEIDAGVCEEMTYEQIAALYPSEFAQRDADKYHYRYPKGESYEDLVARLEPVIIELERQRDVLVIGHQAVLRCLLGYFRQRKPDEIPYERVPLHAVIKLTPRVDGLADVELADDKQFFNIAATDTHRSKPAIVEPTRSQQEALATTPDAELRVPLSSSPGPTPTPTPLSLYHLTADTDDEKGDTAVPPPPTTSATEGCSN